MREDKKAEERRQLSWLAECHPAIFALEWQEGETPDFWAEDSDYSIGLEITRYVHPCEMNPPRVARERFIEHLRQRCIELSLGRRLPVSHVSAPISPERWLSQHNIGTLADALVTFVAQRVPAPSEHTDVNESELPPIAVEHGINSMSIYCPSKMITDPFWAFHHAGFMPSVSMDRLVSLVAEKNRLRKGFKDRFAETWLLIIGEAFGLSTWVNPPAPEELTNTQSQFTRTFFFTLSTCRLVEARQQKC